MEKGETLEWIVEDKRTLTVRRIDPKEASRRRGAHGPK
jgi:hypothetical protein